MDKDKFAERLAMLQQVADVLNKLPPEVRAAAFSVLEPYIKGAPAIPPTPAHTEQTEQEEEPDAGSDALFTKHDHSKPADNVKLIAAHLYQQYGTEPFSVDEVRSTANRVGLTIPARPDATLSAMKVDGKALFNSAGRGKYRPTVHGEAYFRGTYAVRKGSKRRPTAPEHE